MCMIETATQNKGTVFAYDEDGHDICVADHVVHNRKLYQVTALKHDVSGDGLYRETVYLHLMHVKTAKIKIIEDCDVALVN